MFSVFVINSITPFVLYEKLQMVAHKYMYVVEKYGYLTDSEEALIESNLIEYGFEKDDISIEAPKNKKEYGELVYLNISYNYKQKIPTWNGTITYKVKDIPLKVRKVSISKT